MTEFITSPVGAVVKYCNEHVCECVCLSTRVSLELHTQFLPNFLHVADGRGSVLLW